MQGLVAKRDLFYAQNQVPCQKTRLPYDQGTMIDSKEYIRHEGENDEAWICLCGNQPHYDGFFPCDEDGNEMVPAEGWKNLYVCAQCGRIIDQDSLEVVDKNPNFTLLP